jgi:hypothetical protein
MRLTFKTKTSCFKKEVIIIYIMTLTGSRRRINSKNIQFSKLLRDWKNSCLGVKISHNATVKFATMVHRESRLGVTGVISNCSPCVEISLLWKHSTCNLNLRILLDIKLGCNILTYNSLDFLNGGFVSTLFCWCAFWKVVRPKCSFQKRIKC